MKIDITCHTGDFLNLSDLKQFQGKLKYREKEDIEKVKKSILKYGFSFPFFVWKGNDKKNYILDGHGRELALKELEQEEYEIPPLPIVYITAKNTEEAKEKLLRINSRFGDITNKSFEDFAKDLNFDFNSIDIRFEQELKEMKPVNVEPPKHIETTIKHIPSFANSSPTQENIESYKNELENKFEKKVEDRQSVLCNVKCPCCGKTFCIERYSLLVKIGAGY